MINGTDLRRSPHHLQVRHLDPDGSGGGAEEEEVGEEGEAGAG